MNANSLNSSSLAALFASAALIFSMPAGAQQNAPQPATQTSAAASDKPNAQANALAIAQSGNEDKPQSPASAVKTQTVKKQTTQASPSTVNRGGTGGKADAVGSADASVGPITVTVAPAPVVQETAAAPEASGTVQATTPVPPGCAKDGPIHIGFWDKTVVESLCTRVYDTETTVPVMAAPGGVIKINADGTVDLSGANLQPVTNMPGVIKNSVNTTIQQDAVKVTGWLGQAAGATEQVGVGVGAAEAGFGLATGADRENLSVSNSAAGGSGGAGGAGGNATATGGSATATSTSKVNNTNTNTNNNKNQQQQGQQQGQKQDQNQGQKQDNGPPPKKPPCKDDDKKKSGKGGHAELERPAMPGTKAEGQSAVAALG